MTSIMQLVPRLAGALLACAAWIGTTRAGAWLTVQVSPTRRAHRGPNPSLPAACRRPVPDRALSSRTARRLTWLSRGSAGLRSRAAGIEMITALSADPPTRAAAAGVSRTTVFQQVPRRTGL